MKMKKKLHNTQKPQRAKKGNSCYNNFNENFKKRRGGGGVKDTKIIKRPGRQNSNGIFSDRELLLKQ